MSTTTGEPATGTPLREVLRSAARTAGPVSLVGLLCGWFVVGVLSRLAMTLLAVLNPAAAGVTSDDGFEIGQFTLAGSANLMFLTGTFFGLVGAGLYLALRGLMVGPPWFRLLSISLGPAVVVGSQLVHVDGVDFTLLGPVWLAVALFLLIPAVYVALLSVLSERLLARDRPPPTSLVLAGLAAWVVALPLLPLLLALAAGVLLLELARRREVTRRVVELPAWPWLLRAGLVAVFVLALRDLVDDVRILT